MLFLYTLKRSGYKIVQMTLILITTGGMLLISLFLSRWQANMLFAIENEKRKAECPFLMYWLFMKIKHSLLLSILNLLLVEFLQMLTGFYHLPVSLILFSHFLIDASEYPQVKNGISFK